jgi:hypothetical protein
MATGGTPVDMMIAPAVDMMVSTPADMMTGTGSK